MRSIDPEQFGISLVVAEKGGEDVMLPNGEKLGHLGADGSFTFEKKYTPKPVKVGVEE